VTDFEKYLPLGKQLILTGLAVKEGVKKAFFTHGYEITNEQFALLLPLWNMDGQSQIELCDKTCKSKPNVTRILDTMEKRDLVIRRADDNDRRKCLVFLTDYGKQLKKPLIEIALEYGTCVMQGFHDDEIERFIDFLSRVRENIPE